MTIIVLGSPISLVTAHLHFSLTPEIILSLSLSLSERRDPNCVHTAHAWARYR